MLKRQLSMVCGALFGLGFWPVAFAEPAPDPAGCQAKDPSVAIPACTALIDAAATAAGDKAIAYALRGRALTFVAYAEDTKIGQDWRDCITAETQPALAACTRLIDNPTLPDARRADALFQRSQRLSQEGLGKVAMADFQKSLKPFTDHKPPTRERALEDYSSAIKLDPANSRALAERGQIYLTVENIELAAADFDAAIALNAKEGIALFGRALLREAKGDPVGAVSDLKSIVALPADTEEAKWLNGAAKETMTRIGAD